MKLNSIQIKLLNKWNHDSRYSYNKTINLLNDNFNGPTYHNTKPENISCTYSKLELRNLITPAEVCCRIPWILETPKHIRESAVFEAHKNMKSGITNIKNGHIKYFNLTYKSKRLNSWTIGIPKTALNIHNNNCLGIYEERTTCFRIKTTEKIERINNDCTIHFNGLNYYICIPEEKEVKTNNKNNWVCSLDPGNRKFQTIYSPTSDNYTIIGERASSVLYNKLLTLDKLLSKPIKNKLKIKKLRNRIKNLQSELHNKTIKFLCENYNEINLPKLTKENDIIRKCNRKINTKTVRNMTVLGHSMFIEKLKVKANLYKNVLINIVTEEYTSQRCLNCSCLTKTSSEIYVCKNCKFKIDRDILGSTNILIKKMRDTANVDIRCSLDMLEWRKLVANSIYLSQKITGW